MEISFYKYQGAGNDFILVDNRNKYVSLTTEQINKLCERRFGIGADGLMLLQRHAEYDFEMKYYNADGKEGSMCGNGGRCIVRFAYDLGIHQSRYNFLAVDGPHEATIEFDGWVHLKMKDVDKVDMNRGDFIIDTGSPHYIKPERDVMHVDVVKEGREIRFNDTYKKNGINVNFVEETDNYIYVRTYERGVEDETLSCGTGVTASALAYAHNEYGFNRVEVKTRGGNLAVEFNKTGEESFRDIWLCGPATFVYKGSVKV